MLAPIFMISQRTQPRPRALHNVENHLTARADLGQGHRTLEQKWLTERCDWHRLFEYLRLDSNIKTLTKLQLVGYLGSSTCAEWGLPI